MAAQCRTLVRAADYEAFCAGLLFPHRLQPAYFALRAFNAEVAHVAERVRETQLGRVRLQWWSDALNAKTDTGNAVVSELRRHTESKLSKTLLRRLVTAREGLLSRPYFASLAEAEAFGESTSCTLLYLQLQLLGVDPVARGPVHTVAEHIGQAHALANLLRSVPRQAQRQECLLPVAVLGEHGLGTQDVLRLAASPENRDAAARLQDAVFALATRAHDHLLTAQREAPQAVPPELFPALAVAVPVAQLLAELERARFDVFSPRLRRRTHVLWRMWWQLRVRRRLLPPFRP